nr:hypothetical protein DM860_010446 [Ipomoea batatas]
MQEAIEEDLEVVLGVDISLEDHLKHGLPEIEVGVAGVLLHGHALAVDPPEALHRLQGPDIGVSGGEGWKTVESLGLEQLLLQPSFTVFIFISVVPRLLAPRVQRANVDDFDFSGFDSDPFADETVVYSGNTEQEGSGDSRSFGVAETARRGGDSKPRLEGAEDRECEVLESDSPFPKDTTSKFSTLTEKGNSCLLLRTCVRARTVGLFMATPLPTAEVLVLSSTDLSSSAQ